MAVGPLYVGLFYSNVLCWAFIIKNRLLWRSFSGPVRGPTVTYSKAWSHGPARLDSTSVRTQAPWSLSWPVELSWIGSSDVITLKTQLNKKVASLLSVVKFWASKHAHRISRLTENWRLFCRVEFKKRCYCARSVLGTDGLISGKSKLVCSVYYEDLAIIRRIILSIQKLEVSLPITMMLQIGQSNCGYDAAMMNRR